MDKDAVCAALVGLTREMTNRTKIGQLREIFEQIELAQQAGVKNTKIVETLYHQGLTLTLKSFEMMLYRIRKQRSKAADHAMSATQMMTYAHQAVSATRAFDLLDSSKTDETKPSSHFDDLSGVGLKQRRERLGEQFIKDAPSNSLIKLIKKQQK